LWRYFGVFHLHSTFYIYKTGIACERITSYLDFSRYPVKILKVFYKTRNSINLSSIKLEGFILDDFIDFSDLGFYVEKLLGDFYL